MHVRWVWGWLRARHAKQPGVPQRLSASVALLAEHPQYYVVERATGPCLYKHPCSLWVPSLLRFCPKSMRLCKHADVSCCETRQPLEFNPWCPAAVTRHRPAHNILFCARQGRFTHLSVHRLHMESPCLGRNRTQCFYSPGYGYGYFLLLFTKDAAVFQC